MLAFAIWNCWDLVIILKKSNPAAGRTRFAKFTTLLFRGISDHGHDLKYFFGMYFLDSIITSKDIMTMLR